jgi:hypothetical protein
MQAWVSGGWAYRGGDSVLFAPVARRAGGFSVEARGALEQGADDLGVGYNAALAHRVGEVGVGRDPVLDGTRLTPK